MYKNQRELSSNYFNESIFEMENATRKTGIQESSTCRDATSDNKVVGRIIGVSSDSSYKRLFVRKVLDKFVYGQKMSDVCNTIIVRSKAGDDVTDAHIYVYGQMAGGIAELKVGSALEADGKFDSRNRFMARKIYVDSVRICTQFENEDLLLWLVPMIMLFIYIVINTVISGISTVIIGNEVVVKWLMLFLTSFYVTYRGMRKAFKYYLPFRIKLKLSVIAGTVMSIIFMMIF